MGAFCEIHESTVKLLARYSGAACHPSTKEAEVQGPGDGEFKASLGYVLTCLKKPKWDGFITTTIFIDIEVGGVLRYILLSR